MNKTFVTPIALVAVDLTIAETDELSIMISFNGHSNSFTAPNSAMNTHQLAEAIEELARAIPGLTPLRMGSLLALQGFGRSGSSIDISVSGKPGVIRHSVASVGFVVEVPDANPTTPAVVGAIAGAVLSHLLTDK